MLLNFAEISRSARLRSKRLQRFFAFHLIELNKHLQFYGTRVLLVTFMNKTTLFYWTEFIGIDTNGLNVNIIHKTIIKHGVARERGCCLHQLKSKHKYYVIKAFNL